MPWWRIVAVAKLTLNLSTCSETTYQLVKLVKNFSKSSHRTLTFEKWISCITISNYASSTQILKVYNFGDWVDSFQTGTFLIELFGISSVRLENRLIDSGKYLKYVSSVNSLHLDFDTKNIQNCLRFFMEQGKIKFLMSNLNSWRFEENRSQLEWKSLNVKNAVFTNDDILSCITYWADYGSSKKPHHLVAPIEASINLVNIVWATNYDVRKVNAWESAWLVHPRYGEIKSCLQICHEEKKAYVFDVEEDGQRMFVMRCGPSP